VERSAEGLISFRFTRPLVSGEAGVRSIDATQPVPFIWAQGNSWRAGQVTGRDEHTSYSSSAVRVDLQSGAATTDKVDHLPSPRPAATPVGALAEGNWKVLPRPLPVGELTFC